MISKSFNVNPKLNLNIIESESDKFNNLKKLGLIQDEKVIKSNQSINKMNKTIESICSDIEILTNNIYTQGIKLHDIVYVNTSSLEFMNEGNQELIELNKKLEGVFSLNSMVYLTLGLLMLILD